MKTVKLEDSEAMFLFGMVKTKLTKTKLKKLLANFKDVKSYNFFGTNEYEIFSVDFSDIALIDINTKEVYIKNTIVLEDYI